VELQRKNEKERNVPAERMREIHLNKYRKNGSKR
jgi:hypothetical protein